jgi:hypothetical protein
LIGQFIFFLRGRCEDIARQLVEAVVSGKIKVAFGGGLEKFRDEGTTFKGRIHREDFIEQFIFFYLLSLDGRIQ